MRISDWSSDVCSSDLGLDKALLSSHVDKAPSLITIRNAAHDARLRTIENARACFGSGTQGMHAARYDGRWLIAEQADVHPSLRSIWILYLAPMGIDGDDFHWKIAAAINPVSRIIHAGTGPHPGLIL